MAHPNHPGDHDAAALLHQEDERRIDVARHCALLVVACTLGLVANWIGTGSSPLVALPGMLVLFAICVVGLVMARFIPFYLPSRRLDLACRDPRHHPGVPGSAFVTAAVEQLNFLALATPALAYAGLALTQNEFAIARRSGWKIVIVAICVMLGTYLGSVVIADLTLRLGS